MIQRLFKHLDKFSYPKNLHNKRKIIVIRFIKKLQNKDKMMFMKDIFSFLALLASPILRESQIPPQSEEEEPDFKMTREEFMAKKMWFERSEMSWNEIDRLEFNRA